jgi:hypothetical protein
MSGTYSNAPCTEEGYTNFSYPSNSCGIFVIALFHETKIPTVDIEVRVYSKKNSKKMKSPSSMKNGRFHTSKCRGNLQKMEVLYTHSSKLPGPPSNFLITPKKIIKKSKNSKAVSLAA